MENLVFFDKAEVLYPRAIVDMVDFLLREVIRREVTLNSMRRLIKWTRLFRL